MRYLLVSDLDGTLLGDEDALQRFRQWIEPRRPGIGLAYASGRNVDRILQSIHATVLPAPDAVIGEVGSDIRIFPSLEPVDGWNELIEDGWDAERIRELMAEEPDLEYQPDKHQSEHKVSYWLEDASEQRLEELEQTLREAGIKVNLIYSSSRDLDFLPAGVDKGAAAEHLARQWNIEPDRVLVAGNSANDAALLERGFREIVVANAHDELIEQAEGEAYIADEPYAEGVRQGLKHWIGSELARRRHHSDPSELDLYPEGYLQALELLRRCQTEDGFLATPSRQVNYHRVWARDGSIVSLAALVSGESDLIETARATLLTLSSHQGPEGQIPSNVDPRSARTSYGGTAGRVDADLWFLIACGQYWRRTGDEQFLEQVAEPIERVRFLLRAWEFNRRGLLYVPQTGDWADEYLHTGYVLYDQLLYLRAQQEVEAIHHHVHGGEDHELHDRVVRLKHLIQANYWLEDDDNTEIPEDVYHEVLYRRGRRAAPRRCGPYWLAYFSPAAFGYRFDALANVLVSLLGLADDGQRQQVDAFIQQELIPSNLALLPAFHPVITPRDEAWDELQMMFSYSFKNEPHQYQNGGLWPMITGFYVADLASRGEQELAFRFLEAIHVANASRVDGHCWSFPEYLHGKELTPGGQTGMGWSAAAAIIGTRALLGEPLLSEELPS